ncbi:hypothetical protein FRB99_007594, partial [Tulasnella sp. 403]
MRFHLFSLVVPLVLLSPAYGQNESGLENPNLRPLVSRANVLLTAGHFQDAARSLSEAIELSPADYSLYYKRATAYFSLNRHNAALDDVDTVLRMTDGTFHQALLMKARILAKEGEWLKARQNLKRYTAKVGNGDKEAVDLLFGISEGEVAAGRAFQAHRQKKWDNCLEQSTLAIGTASHSISLREIRADCALMVGDVEFAVGDLTRLAHLQPPAKATLLRVAQLSYYLTPPSGQAMSALKQCLHHDPDDKGCRASHRLFKSFNKDLEKAEKAERTNDWKGVLRVLVGYQENEGLIKKFDKEFNKALETMDLPAGVNAKKMSGMRKKLYKLACRSYGKDSQPRKAVDWCEEVLKMDENDLDALMNRGDVALVQEAWDEAVRAFEKAFEASGRSSQEVHAKLQKAHRLLKQSKQKDYYKVLGVARDADGRAIKKAYRQKARDAHPDKGGSEAKMAAINEAYEVLSNAELRARFDNGDDPNDPDGGR